MLYGESCERERLGVSEEVFLQVVGVRIFVGHREFGRTSLEGEAVEEGESFVEFSAL